MRRESAVFQRLTYSVLGMLVACLVAACGHSANTVTPSPALEAAQRLEQRAQAAFVKGDWVTAQTSYVTAARVYSSLDLQEPYIQTQLNLARVDSVQGQDDLAIRRLESLLDVNQDAISSNTQRMIHGRLAALHIKQNKLSEAKNNLDSAQKLCISHCLEVAALNTLRAQWYLATNDSTQALTFANLALGQAEQASDKANALRLRTQAQLMGKNAASAVQDAQAALRIDQDLGQSDRVIVDLELLEKLMQALGDDKQAQSYRRQKQRAQTAREQLSR